MQELFKPVPRRYSIGMWLAAGALGFLLCLYHLSGTLVDGAFVPADYDSLYHARRIIDALGNPLHPYQFDARIHAPEGSWVTWPWAYDALMACVAVAGMALTGARDPMTILAFVAPAWVFVNAALFLGIAARLRLSLPMQALALLFFATSPLTQALHRIGMLDHHYVEYTFVLATLYLGLGWFEDLASRRRAAALGVLLGAAPAFHNGLFVLQLPVLITLACLWLLGRPIDRRASLAFAMALVAATLVLLLPSEPFRRGEFSYYLHSAFHLYVACCTALLCVLASRVRFTWAAAVATCVLIAALTAPVLRQVLLGGDFLFSSHPYLKRLEELGSIPGDIAAGNWWRLTVSYSPLLWLLPLGIAGLFWRLRRDAGNASLYFLVQSLFGAFLLLQSFRLHYFGSFALILPICRLVDDVRTLRPAWFASLPRAAAAGAIAIATLLPSVLGLRFADSAAGEENFSLMRIAYQGLASACRRAPGVALSGPNEGHFIRYYSECSTIADNFVTTPQHVRQLQLAASLMEASVSELKRDAPYVRYVLVRGGEGAPRLTRELMAPGGPAPAGTRLLVDLWVTTRTGAEPYVRLYEVLDSPGENLRSPGG